MRVSVEERPTSPATTEMAEQAEAQFQADLKRALELSMETAAQDDARRDSSVGCSGSGRSIAITFRYSLH